MTQFTRPERFGVIPLGVEITTFEKYDDAQYAVDALADSGFPVEKVALIGTDLKRIERVTGRLSYGRAALSGGLSGMWFGLMMGALFVLLGSQTAAPMLLGVTVGLVFGAVFGLLAYGMSGGRRDFTSVTQVVATRYGLQCAPEVAAQCRQVLTEKGVLRAAAAPRPLDLSEPPQFGERITPPVDPSVG